MFGRGPDDKFDFGNERGDDPAVDAESLDEHIVPIRN